jgi:hypothetical protein
MIAGRGYLYQCDELEELTPGPALSRLKLDYDLDKFSMENCKRGILQPQGFSSKMKKKREEVTEKR